MNKRGVTRLGPGNRNGPTITSPSVSPYYSVSNSVTISGTCTSGSTVVISGSLNSETSCQNNSFSFVDSRASDGSYSYQITENHLQNGLSASTTFVWVRDTQAPAAIIVNSPSASPHYSNTNSVTVSGNCEIGASVRVSGGTTQTLSCSTGTFSFTTTKSSDQSYDYTVVQSDRAGNDSSPTALQWIRDTISPATPTITSPASSPHYSSTNSISISGACENNATVQLAGATSSSTTCSGGTYTLTSNQNSDGTYNYTVRQVDRAGNASSTVAQQWIRDATPPDPPVILVPAVSPLANNLNTITISGTCLAGATVQLSGSSSLSQTCTGGGTFSFESTKNTDATYNYSLNQVDLAGNTSSSVVQQWIRDTVAPAAPVVLVPNSTPYTSADDDLTISGTCEIGATVNLTGSTTSSQSCTGGGTFSFSSNKTSDGTYNYSLRQSDAVGNQSLATNIQWIRDTGAADPPVVTSPTSPHYSSVDTVDVEGTCELGHTVYVTGATTQDFPCDGSGNFSFSDFQDEDDTYTYTIHQEDGLGNASASTTFLWVRDTGQPGPPVIVSPEDNPFYSNDNDLVISGGCEVGATVQLTGDDAQSMTCNGDGEFEFTISKIADDTYDFSINQVDLAGNTSSAADQQWIRDTDVPAAPVVTNPVESPFYSSDDSLSVFGTCEAGTTIEVTGALVENSSCSGGGTFSFADTQNSNGTYTYTIRQRDLAGNLSAAATQVWERDNSTPDAPTITTPATNPFYSNSTGLTISGACSTGNTVYLSGSTTDSFVCAANAYTFSVTKLVEGTYNFSVLQENPFGTESGSVSLQWILDQTLPAAPTVTSPIISPYTSNSDSITVTGDCEVNATIEISGSYTDSINCTTGTYTFTDNQIVDNTYTYTIRQRDRADNLSAATVQEWTRNASIPPTPVLTNPLTNPYYSNVSTLTISGSCVTGNTVVLAGASDQTMSCSGSSFSFNVSAGVEGSFVYSVHQTNALAEESAAADLTWIYDATAPDAPTIVNPAISPYVSGIGLTISGACEANATVRLRYNGGAQIKTVVCSSNSNYTLTHDEASDGTYNYEVGQIDRAGNASPWSSLEWDRDSLVPVTPIITSPTENPYISSANSLTITGTCENGATVQVAGSMTSSTTCVGGTFSFTNNQTSDGSYTYSIRQRDLANNLSAATTQIWIRDSGPPSVTILTGPTATNYLSYATFTYSATETVTYECKLDTEAFTSCPASPPSKTYAVVENGARTFTIRARDTAGNVSDEETWDWTQSAYNTVALFHFDSATGQLADESAFANDLTNSNSTLAASGGYFGDARDFVRSSSQSVFAPYDAESFATARARMTFEAFVNFDSIPASNGQMMTIASQSKINSACANDCGWSFGLKRQGSNYRFFFYGSTGGTSMTEIRSDNLTVNTNTWYHVAVTWDRGTVKLYRDGTLLKTGTIGTAGSSTLFNSTYPLRIGGWDGSHYFDGRIDEARWSSTVRTDLSIPVEPFEAD